MRWKPRRRTLPVGQMWRLRLKKMVARAPKWATLSYYVLENQQSRSRAALRHRNDRTISEVLSHLGRNTAAWTAVKEWGWHLAQAPHPATNPKCPMKDSIMNQRRRTPRSTSRCAVRMARRSHLKTMMTRTTTATRTRTTSWSGHLPASQTKRQASIYRSSTTHQW